MKDALTRASELLQLADDDLVAAEAIAATGEALRAVCFHAQQLAEKSLKALLATEDLSYPKTHDIGVLTTLGVAAFPGLGEWAEALEALTPYAVAGRYELTGTPTLDRARALLDTARRFNAWARQMVIGRLKNQEAGE